MGQYLIDFIDYVLRDPFAQITGFCAIIATIFAYFQKDDITVKKLMLLSSFFWGTHFYLLGVYAGLAAVVLSISRLLLSLKFQKNRNAFLGISIAALIVGYFTFDGIYSLIPIVTSISGAYAFFYLDKIRLRFAMLFSSSLWLVYHVSIGSVSGMINEILIHIILIMTLYRMAHPLGGTRYYANKIKDILWKRSRPDYDRFIFIHDRVTHYRKILGNSFHTILHYDLALLFPKRKSIFLIRLFDKKKDKSVVDLIH